MSEVFKKKKGAIFQSNNSNYFKWFLFKRIVYNLLFLFVFIGFKYLNIFQEIFLCTFYHFALIHSLNMEIQIKITVKYAL